MSIQTSQSHIRRLWDLPVTEKRVSRYLPAYRIEGQKEDENGAASPFLLLKSVSDDVDWPHNDNRVHGKRYRRMNGRH
jgi:hypothetical protein